MNTQKTENTQQNRELIEISQWSDKMIEWQTGLYINFADIWGLRHEEKQADAVKKYIQKKEYNIKPQEFINELAKEKKYNPLIAGAIINALIDNNDSEELFLDTTQTPEPLNFLGAGLDGNQKKIHIKGNLGKGCFQCARNLEITVDGSVGPRFAARSSNTHATISESAGELYGFQASGLVSKINKNLTGFNALRESYDCCIHVAGDILAKDFGCKSQRLKAIIEGNAPHQGHLRDSAHSEAIFKKNVGHFFAEQAIGLNAVVLGDISSIGFAYEGEINKIACAGKVKGYGSPQGSSSQKIAYIPLERKLSKEEWDLLPKNILVGTANIYSKMLEDPFFQVLKKA